MRGGLVAVAGFGAIGYLIGDAKGAAIGLVILLVLAIMIEAKS